MWSLAKRPKGTQRISTKGFPKGHTEPDGHFRGTIWYLDHTGRSYVPQIIFSPIKYHESSLEELGEMVPSDKGASFGVPAASRRERNISENQAAIGGGGLCSILRRVYTSCRTPASCVYNTCNIVPPKKNDHREGLKHLASSIVTTFAAALHLHSLHDCSCTYSLTLPLSSSCHHRKLKKAMRKKARREKRRDTEWKRRSNR